MVMMMTGPVTLVIVTLAVAAPFVTAVLTLPTMSLPWRPLVIRSDIIALAFPSAVAPICPDGAGRQHRNG